MFEKTELCLITTLRCNAKCQMCHIWKHPTKASEEFTVEDVKRLPSGFERINLGGGEPTLRKDLVELADVVATKAKHFEISTNGSFPERLVAVGKRHPKIRIRISIEGLSAKNDEIRGIENGYDRAMQAMLALRKAGVKDIGFALTISHRNAKNIVEVYQLASAMGVEFTQAIVHDAWQFHIENNVIEDKELVIGEIKNFIRELLQSTRSNARLRTKDWFRAYLNRGFINFVRGDKRLLPCGAGTDVVFVHPDGTVFPCNALKEPLGNIRTQDFVEIWQSERAREVRRITAACKKNCWMTGTSRPALKRNPLKPIQWVMKNKLRLRTGKDIDWS